MNSFIFLFLLCLFFLCFIVLLQKKKTIFKGFIGCKVKIIKSEAQRRKRRLLIIKNIFFALKTKTKHKNITKKPSGLLWKKRPMSFSYFFEYNEFKKRSWEIIFLSFCSWNDFAVRFTILELKRRSGCEGLLYFRNLWFYWVSKCRKSSGEKKHQRSNWKDSFQKQKS